MIATSAIGPATEHDERVSRYVALLARLVGLDRRASAELAQASRLHDIGKVTIPQEILDKPGSLDDFERSLIQCHAELGHHLLHSPGNAFLMLAATVAWTHHERWDGGGYPRRLRGEEIPLAGRIVAICDVFDALTSDRVYRPALSIDDALVHMRLGRGTAFDPALIDVFLDSIDEFIAADAAADGSLVACAYGRNGNDG
jgi:putative two-component system response regulator